MSTKTNTLRYDFEPWYCGELLRENGTSICAFAEEPSKENAARLVSSWNVCRDSTVEELAAIEQSGATLVSIANERDELQARLEQGKAVWKQDHGRMAEIVARRDEAIRVLDGLLEYFRSGNDVSVPQATIRADSPEVKAAFDLVGRLT